MIVLILDDFMCLCTLQDKAEKELTVSELAEVQKKIVGSWTLWFQMYSNEPWKKIITIILFHDFTTFLIAKAKAKALVGLVWWAHNPIESPIYPRYSFPIWSSSKVFQLHDPLEPLGLLHLGHAVIGLHGTYPHAQTWRLQIRLFLSPKR